MRCARSGFVHFTKEVTEDICRVCPHFLAEVEEATNRAICGKPKPKPPSKLRRMLTWAEAVAGWTTAGCPVRDDDEIQTIFQSYCSKPCDWFDPATKVCRNCGCNVKEGGFAIFNKIKMATQHCPLGLW
jgi:hypothetical protein